ncbi:MAG: MazG nucleotide pyrophosphohydrolase domain-containing protein [Clostridia bacterium]|nr:mazG nucleotide pyrophosphohydrolase [Clostridium sp. CAG:389]
MDLEEYKKIALARLNKSIAFDQKENMYYACMGLVEETGEIIAELRKPLFKGNFHEKPLDTEEIKKELGDLMWYIALICKNANIDTDQLKDIEIKEDAKISKRERIIQIAINMGQVSGQIVEKYLKLYNENTNNVELIEEINRQYENICNLAEKFNLTIDEILEENIRKVNFRYNEKGENQNNGQEK